MSLRPADVVEWAVTRWQSEVANRPIVNMHRRTLDGTWRQVIRHFGGDPDALVGPSHDELIDTTPLATPPAPTPSAAATGAVRTLSIDYTNYRGETATRNIIPRSVRFGSTEWHPEEQWILLAWDNDKQADREFALKDFGPSTAAIRAAPFEEATRVPIKPDDVEWVVNDIAELGVKIGEQFFFLYKGRSLVYGTDELSSANGVALNEDTDPPTQHMWRPVFKREFGECAHPINYTDPTKIGTVSLDDSDDWKPLPAAIRAAGEK